MEDEAIRIDIKALTEISEDGLLSPLCCIYSVPTTIRLLNERAYTPQVVSIGPFHHGDMRLQEMERQKKIMFKRFVQRAMIDSDSLVNLAIQSEPKIQAHPEDDAKVSKSWLEDAILNDLVLLENQLPFFFLEELYDIAFPHNNRGDLPSFIVLTYSYFDNFNMQNLEPNHKTKHFTDLLRLFCLPRAQVERKSFAMYGSDTLMYSANELHEAGVKLMASTSKYFLDLKFSSPFLEIPPIYVGDMTETLFCNLMALEQCHYPFQPYFCDYIFLLDILIKTNKDVEVLAHEKIINGWHGDANEVARLFNGFGKNIIQPNLNVEYLNMSKGLNEFYEDPWHKRKETLRRDYYNTPLQTMASIAAIMLLILTITQSICSILQVV
ncbi:UPF0481 protein At3g47200-like [Neltuma alba]|uniref:UPF0481 protein At3g47200-like n=1 Tax=Neltuma alba TaxID=207710 RepID=UPI0010A596CB|nr:UPF0481 protein At3g47200-like [Prosopis alba]